MTIANTIRLRNVPAFAGAIRTIHYIRSRHEARVLAREREMHEQEQKLQWLMSLRAQLDEARAGC